MSRVLWFVHRQSETLGPAGLLTLALAFCCAGLYQWAWLPAQQAYDEAKSTPHTEIKNQPSKASPEVELQAFLADFPALQERSASLDTLLQLAAEEHIALNEISYKLERTKDDALAHYHVDFDMTARYPVTRRYLNRLLLALPHASLDSLSLHRDDLEDGLVQTRVRLTLHFVHH